VSEPGGAAEADGRLAAVVIELLVRAEATVAVAESLTGGLLAAELTAVSGASRAFRGSVTAYATDLKASLLGVPADLLAVHGAVHQEVAGLMAAGVRQRLGATYGVGVTGVAGPDPAEGKPVGTVFVGVAGPAGITVECPKLSGDRATIRGLTVTCALNLLRRVIV
jgi:PncC family amidohydrolase